MRDKLEYFALIYLEKAPYPEIEIELFIDKAPNTVNNFVNLVRDGFYDGLAFHRVVEGELVQTGDPTGTGDGGPGYAIEDEFHPDLNHSSEGIVAMAESDTADGGTHGSQFYITLAPLPERDGLKTDGSPKDCEKLDVSCHSVFGRVIRGMNFVNAFARDAHDNAIQEGDTIRKIEIVTQYTPDSPSASIPPDCSNGVAVPRPQSNSELVDLCKTLLGIKRTFAGNGKLNWSEEISIKNWHGIELDWQDRKITVLNLHRWGLTGTIPPEIGELVDLEVLNLSHNRLSGEIPNQIGNLRNLRDLNISGNRLNGEIPGTLWNLNKLTGLSLGENELTGQLPPEISNLTLLTSLSIQVAQLSGPIPIELTQLPRLQWLTLALNRFSGNIPPDISKLTNLIELRLNGNKFTGEIPSELGRLTKLEVLDLAGNQLAGNVPQELGNLTNLQSFYIAGNYLDGCIPDELKRFDVSVNTLLYCSAPPIAWAPQSVFAGGSDLAVTYIERQPRYSKYKVSLFAETWRCEYPYTEPKGPVVCPDNQGVKRNPEPGETVQLIAHVRNFGDADVGQFDYVWRVEDQVLETGNHEGLTSGYSAEITIDYIWPEQDSNPIVTFEVDTENQIDEIFEVNNAVHDWIKGHTLGIYFSEETYESLKLSAEVEGEIQSPEHWFRNNIDRLNQMLIEAGVKDRVRTELFFIASERGLGIRHELRWMMDGWWGIWHNTPIYTLEGYRARPEIDNGLLHELIHQLGMIDIYQMILDIHKVQLPDVNRPMHLAGCGLDYWNTEWDCFVFPRDILGIMAFPSILDIGAHTADALRVNAGHRRGFYGEYLFDTPENTTVRIVDKNDNVLDNVELRFYQQEVQKVGDEHRPVVDDVPEFTVTTDEDGIVTLPNRGITGIVTATGHQLQPNPFGIISVVGDNGIFLIEMTSDECTNYEWLTIVELNLAYWDGQTERAEFTKTLRCPPP